MKNNRWVFPEGVECLDFDARFRSERLRRWWRGAHNGLALWSVAGVRLGLMRRVRFDGVCVEPSPSQATYRLIEDIWMRGEYDFAGYIPQPGWRVVDIGANVGIYAMLAARRGAQVVAYEPNPIAFDRLVANTAKWKADCRRGAVTAPGRETVELFLHPLRDTRNTLLGREGGVINTRALGPDRARRAHHYVDKLDVPAIPVDQVLETPCDLLKVACEGGEFEIFAAAGESIRNARRIVLELHTEMRTEHGDADELIDGLRRAGFNVDIHAPHPGMTRAFLTAALRE